MSKIQLLDLFEEQEHSLEEVYEGDVYRYILVPVDLNFQDDDLVGVYPNKWQEIKWIFKVELKTFSREKVASSILSCMEKGMILNSKLRRCIDLFDKGHRYLRLGDTIKKDDYILPSSMLVKAGNYLINEQYTENLDLLLAAGVGYPKFKKVVRKIERK